MILRKIALVLLLTSVIICASCVDGSDLTSRSSEIPSDSNASITISALRSCFKDCFAYDTFADINNDLCEKGVEAFYEVLPENLGALIPLTDNNSAERKLELARAFSGYTYIPKYGDTTAIIVDSIQMEIPSSACYDEYYSGNYQPQFNLNTTFTYIVKVETPDGDGSNYACVNIIHKKDCGTKCRESWQSDINQAKDFLVGGSAVEGIVKNNGLDIQLVVDTNTVINMAFDINLNYPYSFDHHNSDKHKRELSQELYSGEWLTKISFEKIDLWDINGYEYLKYESEVKIPYKNTQ